MSGPDGAMLSKARPAGAVPRRPSAWALLGSLSFALAAIPHAAAASEVVFSEDFEATTLGSSPPDTDNWTIVGAGAWYTANGRCANTQNHTPAGSKSLYSSGGGAGQGIGCWNRPGWGPVVNGRATCWFYDDMAATKIQYIAVDNTAGNNWLSIMVRTPTSAVKYCYRGSMTGGVQVTTIDRTLGWHKVVWERDTNNTALYLDGVTIYSTPNANFNNFSDFDLGSWSWDSVAGNTGMWFDDCLVERGLHQQTYRWYQDNQAQIPTALAAENTPITGVTAGLIRRLRMQLQNDMSAAASGAYVGLRYRRGAAGTWADLGPGGHWTWSNGMGTDKAQVANALLTGTTTREHFVESVPSSSALAVAPAGRGEWDFALQATAAIVPGSTYYFKIVETDASGVYLRDLVGYPVLAQAATTAPGLKVWTGNQNTNWGTANNWSPAGVPTATDIVFIPAAAARDCRVNVNAACAALFLEAGRSLLLTSNNVTLSVSGAVTLDGTVSHTSNSATFSVAAGPVTLTGVYNHSGSGSFSAPAASFTAENGGRYNLTGAGATFSCGALTLMGSSTTSFFNQATGASTVSVGDLDIEFGGEYDCTAAGAVINIADDLVNNGSMIGTTQGSWRFTGASASISGRSSSTRFYDFAVNAGAAAVEAAMPVRILHALTVAAGASLTMDGGHTIEMAAGSSFTAAAGSSVVISGTGLLPGEWATVTSVGGGYFSMSLAGGLDIFAARFVGLANEGLALSSAAGTAVSFENVIFEAKQGANAQYLNITGAAWNGYSFYGLAFDEVGAGPNTTGTVRISVAGAAATVVMVNYGSSAPPWSSGESTDIDVGDDNVIWAPLAATLTELALERTGEGTLVRWDALSERGTAGYRVFRAVAGEPDAGGAQAGHAHRALEGFGPWKSVSPLIRATGVRGGGSYSWLDLDAPRGETAAYMVEELELSGRPGSGLSIMRLRAEEHRAGSPPARSAVARVGTSPDQRAQAAKGSAVMPAAKASAKGSGATFSVRGLSALDLVCGLVNYWALQPGGKHSASGTVKLTTRGEGIFAVAASEVEEIDPAANRLSSCGERRGLRLKGGFYRFYAEESTSRYSDENVFWMGKGGSGAGFQRTSGKSAWGPGKAAPSPVSYTERERVESNEYYYAYYPDLTEGRTDRWYFDWVIEPDWPLAVSITLHKPLAGRAKVRASVLGYSGDPDVVPDHHLVVEVNGHAVGEAGWDGYGLGVVEASFDAGILTDGENTVTLSAPGDTGAWADWMLLDWVEMEYPRPLEAAGGEIRFELDAPRGMLVSVGGFPSADIEVVDASSPERSFIEPEAVTDDGPGGWTVSFRTAARGTRVYYAASAEAFRTPLVSASASTGRLRRGGKGGRVDYAVIAAPGLMEAVEPLVAARSKLKNFKVVSASLDEVADEFGFGLSSPDAVREFAKAVRPGHLLLVGAGTLDFRNYSGGRPENVLPNYVTSDGISEVATDNPFGCLDDKDELPDIAVGRLPAASAEELSAMVEKILAREEGAGSPAYGAVLLADDGEPLFEEVIAEAALAFGEPRRDLYLSDYADAADATADFTAAVAEGTRLMVFFGHGSNDLWSNRMVLGVDDVGTLDCGGGYPISLQFSCLTGDYASGWPSMATAMILRPGDGVAAVVGSSGFSPSSDQAELARAMTGLLSGAAPVSMGQCLAEAKRRVGAGRPSVVRTFNLLGDPAMK